MINWLFGLTRGNRQQCHPCCWIDSLGVMRAYRSHLRREALWAYLYGQRSGE